MASIRVGRVGIVMARASSSEPSADLRVRIRALNRADRDRTYAEAKACLVFAYGERHAPLIDRLAPESVILSDLCYIRSTYGGSPIDRDRRVLLRTRVEVLLDSADEEPADVDRDALAALLEDVLVSLECL